jgi:hypothetical protein
MITLYEDKTLKDTRNQFNSVSLKEEVEFDKKNPHPRLLKLIAE